MRSKPKALVVGCGAVGRGLLAPLLIDADFMVTFADVRQDVIDRINQMKYYPLIGRGEFRWVGPVDAVQIEDHCHFGDLEEMQYEYIFISVKSNNLGRI